jgi:UMF1 family MFS transporter
MAAMAPVRAADSQKNYPPRIAVVGWIMFAWAAEPFFTLITTFVFAPYFATHVAADPTKGQSLWGFATAASGLVIASMSPLLGGIADASGRRKPWIATFGALLVIGAGLLWFAKPGDVGAIAPLLIAYGLASVGVEPDGAAVRHQLGNRLCRRHPQSHSGPRLSRSKPRDRAHAVRPCPAVRA